MQGWKTLLEIIAIPFAIGYAIVTYFQWQELHRNFTLDERAWIQIKQIPGTTGLDFKYMSLPLELTNVGKSPARNVRILSRAEVLQRDKAPTFDYGKNDSQATVVGVLFQGSPQELDWQSAHPMTELQRISIMSGQNYFVYYVLVNWEDIFGQTHATRFCARVVLTPGITNAKACTDYNDTDAR